MSYKLLGRDPGGKNDSITELAFSIAGSMIAHRTLAKMSMSPNNQTNNVRLHIPANNGGLFGGEVYLMVIRRHCQAVSFRNASPLEVG